MIRNPMDKKPAKRADGASDRGRCLGESQNPEKEMFQQGGSAGKCPWGKMRPVKKGHPCQ